MHKKILIIIIIMCVTKVGYAQKGIYAEFGFGIGSSLVDYSIINPYFESSSSSGFSSVGGIGFTYNFTKRWGIGVGLDYGRYASNMLLNGTRIWKDVIDTDTEIYDHHLQLDDWNEETQWTYLESPIWLQYTYPIIKRLKIQTRVGVKYGFVQSSRFEANGKLVHTGYYPKWHLSLHDISSEGFYTQSNFTPQGRLESKDNLSAISEIGLLYSLSKQVNLMVSAYYHFGLTQGLLLKGKEEIGFQNDRESMDKIHYFMTPYAPLSRVKEAEVASSTLKSQGVRVRLIVQLTDFKRKRKCHCIQTHRGYYKRRH